MALLTANSTAIRAVGFDGHTPTGESHTRQSQKKRKSLKRLKRSQVRKRVFPKPRPGINQKPPKVIETQLTLKLL
jgi:hypothetical protein